MTRDSAPARNIVALAPGLIYVPGYLGRNAQTELLASVRAVVEDAPLFQPVMPRTGAPFSVRMTNCGQFGWLSDHGGYRYVAQHPRTRRAWPAIPPLALQAWRELADYPLVPEACLVNYYDATARMGLHQDRDEQGFRAPVLSLSLGDTCVFRYGGTERRGRTSILRLQSGDALVLSGEARLAFHGVDRILAGSSTLVKESGRFNLTLRRVKVETLSD